MYGFKFAVSAVRELDWSIKGGVVPSGWDRLTAQRLHETMQPLPASCQIRLITALACHGLGSKWVRPRRIQDKLNDCPLKCVSHAMIVLSKKRRKTSLKWKRENMKSRGGADVWLMKATPERQGGMG